MVRFLLHYLKYLPLHALLHAEELVDTYTGHLPPLGVPYDPLCGLAEVRIRSRVGVESPGHRGTTGIVTS